MKPINVEVTSYDGARKWIRDVIGLTSDQILDSWENGERITLKSADGGLTAVDMSEVFAIRFQDDGVYKRRSREMKKRVG
jgi:hypothetical protein